MIFARTHARTHARNSTATAALAVSIHLLVVGVGFAEEDHLKGYKIKDLNQVPGLTGVPLTNQFGNETCDLKKPQFFLVQSEKLGGDDPRGGPAGNFVCYKAKCTGLLPPITDADSQFGVHQLETKKAKLVCLPVNPDVCGDGDLDPGEACDPPGNNTQCLGAVACSATCSCPPPPPCTGGGQPVGGFCWFLGASAASCDATCAGVGQTCNAPGTVSYAGSGGTDANCQAVLAALGVSDPFGPYPCFVPGLGCINNTIFGGSARSICGPTTCAAADVGQLNSRACACQ